MDETLDLLDVLLDTASEPRLKLISADEPRAVIRYRYRIPGERRIGLFGRSGERPSHDLGNFAMP
ncbi:hypothetical protein AB0M92_34530 [Streptomyces sp. NPDC051582]|uniref:hypothetical protein n=1 Tax=Streptomyces sp. NPDC051582 TaxID=3155167 RepID=UPI00343B39A3